MSTPAAALRTRQEGQQPHIHNRTMRGARLEIAIFDALRAGLDTARAISQRTQASDGNVHAVLRRMHLDGLVERHATYPLTYTLADE